MKSLAIDKACELGTAIPITAASHIIEEKCYELAEEPWQSFFTHQAVDLWLMTSGCLTQACNRSSNEEDLSMPLM